MTPTGRRGRKAFIWALPTVAVLVLFLSLERGGETSQADRNVAAVNVAAVVESARGLDQIVQIRNPLRQDSDVNEIRIIARRAAAHGFTGVLLSSSFDTIARQPPEYFDRLARVRAIFDSLGIEVIPRVTSAGYAYPSLANDRDFAAALPVRDALFVARGGRARHTTDSGEVLSNGGFEKSNRHRAEGFRLQDGIGQVSFIDDKVAKEGRASLRFESLHQSKGGMGRVMQRVRVQPFRCYRVSFWVKSENLDNSGQVRGLVLSDDSRMLMAQHAKLTRTEDWKQVTLGFNSLNYDEVLVYAGMWGGNGGRWWVDDIQVHEIGMVNVLRRDGTPVTVRGESNGIVYEEGRDYLRVADPHINFKVDHEGPDIELTPQSRIVEGERLRVDFYQALSINGQIGACLSEDRVYQLWKEAIELVKEHLSPRWYHLGFDEIRHGGWCVACEKRGIGGGEMLAAAIARMTKIVADIDPAAEVIVWSDMLDPNHNATRSEYLFKDGFAGSWENVPRDVIIACWYYKRRIESVRHFDALGHRTLAAAYYDASTVPDMEENAAGWLDALHEVDGGMGIIYTTWRGRYELLEAFGDFISTRRAER